VRGGKQAMGFGIHEEKKFELRRNHSSSESYLRTVLNGILDLLRDDLSLHSGDQRPDGRCRVHTITNLRRGKRGCAAWDVNK
jgi:hypothetical protein